MKAFTNTTVTKSEFLKELKKHQSADAFLRGTYSHIEKNKVGNFRGCAVGCSLHSVARVKKLKNVKYGDHKAYEEHLGIPEWLARVEDRIFEGVSNERAKTWPVEFASAIPIGADLEKVKGPFLCMIMRRSLTRFDHTKFTKVKAAIEETIACWENPLSTPEDFQKARDNAFAAKRGAVAAAAAAWAAEAEAAEAAEAAVAAEAEAEAEAAWAEAEAAAAAAAAAAWAAAEAAWAEAAAEAAWAAKTTEYEYFADELIKILKACEGEK
jgi:hypothetical protein